MENKPLQITFMPSPDDPAEDSGEYQADLHGFSETLQNAGVAPSAVVDLIEAAGHNEITTFLGVFHVGLRALEIVGPAVGVWLHARSGRKVRIKVGDIEAEAQTTEEVAKLLDRAQEIRERNEPKRIIP